MTSSTYESMIVLLLEHCAGKQEIIDILDKPNPNQIH